MFYSSQNRTKSGRASLIYQRLGKLFSNRKYSVLAIVKSGYRNAVLVMPERVFFGYKGGMFRGVAVNWTRKDRDLIRCTEWVVCHRLLGKKRFSTLWCRGLRVKNGPQWKDGLLSGKQKRWKNQHLDLSGPSNEIEFLLLQWVVSLYPFLYNALYLKLPK